MVQYLLSPELKPNYLRNFGCKELARITQYNSTVRKAMSIASANREDHGDVGIMHIIGAKTLCDDYTIGEYTFENTVLNELTRGFVRALSRIGSVVYPDVLAVIQDNEGDAGFQLPPKTMAGDQYGNCVGGKIDMSVDIANASYVDLFKNALQGFCVYYTEEIPGMAYGWHYVMPNLRGTKEDGTQFNGVVVRLNHGTAISCDDRLIRNCTYLSRPDGKEGSFVGGCEETQKDLYYGTFTAAKPRRINVGHRRLELLEKMDEYAYTSMSKR